MEDSATQTSNPEIHKKSGSLQGQAATAALYATNADRKSKIKYPLDTNNKLSSASAATSLKYASAQELPSFPVVGISDPDSSAGAAASLANANQKSFEYWKPGYSSPANQAAHLAADYKAAPLWHPEASAAGSKAATLAAKHGGNVDIWLPHATSEGNSAAGQAMRTKNLSPNVDYGYTEDGHRRALLAATGAMSGRKRSGSTPISTGSYPDSANSAQNALNAATRANRPSGKQRAPVTDLPGLSQADATRIHDAAVTNLGREMYTSHPPVQPEVEEKNRQAGIRAAALSMAKQMYAVQQKAIEDAARSTGSDSHSAANKVHKRQSSISSASDEPYQAQPQYAHLQEAAQKLAAERLAKLYDENAAYKNYYGTQAPVQSRLSIRGRLRRRASSDSELPDSDEARSKQIRSQMSIFNDKLAQVDRKKQQKDRDALMAAAQRNVTKRMQGIDEKVFADTGKVSPAMMDEWETKARARAEADSSARMVNYGKVNIGGGKFIDQSEIDAIAAARIQPTLDEISEKAAAQRALDEQRRQKEIERRRVIEENDRAEKERDLKTKDEWRRFKEDEKREEKAKREQEKARKAEEKRLQEEEKRHREEDKRTSKASPASASTVLAKKTKENSAENSAPVLDPLPKVAPINTESIAPAAEETTEHEPTTTEEVPVIATRETEPVATEEFEPIATEETTAKATETIIPENVTESRAESIVNRVFGAPVTTSSSDVKVPTIASTETAPATETAESEPSTTAPTNEAAESKPSTTATTSNTPDPSTKATGPSTEPSTGLKPVAERVAPPAVANEPTTPTSPKSDKEKEGGTKLTSWLKNKLHRGSASTSKATKPADEGATKQPIAEEHTPAPETAPYQTEPVLDHAHPASEEKTAMTSAVAAGGEGKGPARSRSTSISSLSSDEPTRGAHRLLHTNVTRPTGELAEDKGKGVAVDEGRGRVGSSEGVASGGLKRVSTGGSGEEFEEAKDTFEPGEKMLPVPKVRGVGRVGESPVRDSRFVEDL